MSSSPAGSAQKGTHIYDNEPQVSIHVDVFNVRF